MSCPSCVSCIADTRIIIQIRLFICSSVPYISSNHPTFCTYIFSYLKLLCLYFHIPQLLPTVAIYACAAPPKFCTKCCTGTPLLLFLCIYLYVVNMCICVFWIGVFVCCKFGYFLLYICVFASCTSWHFPVLYPASALNATQAPLSPKKIYVGWDTYI